MDTDEVTLTVRRKGRIYFQRCEVKYTSIPTPSELRELEYQVARVWVWIKRDIAEHDKRDELTNPFAWSPGPQ